MNNKANALSALEHERESVINENYAAIRNIDELAGFKQATISWEKEFRKADTKKQKELIGMVIDRIHISREAVDISFRFSQ
jgi:hypothetical protein